jgi:hypothetical protein
METSDYIKGQPRGQTSWFEVRRLRLRSGNETPHHEVWSGQPPIYSAASGGGFTIN